jgi:hypothetical protein
VTEGENRIPSLRSSRPLLQHAWPQDLLDEDAVLDDRRSGLAGLTIDFNLPLALHHERSVLSESVVGNDGGRNPETPVALPKPR